MILCILLEQSKILVLESYTQLIGIWNKRERYVCFFAVSDCQTRWRNIRNGFVRSLKPTPSGSSTKQKKLYYLHDELQFVLPFVKATIHTGEPGNIPLFPEEETENIAVDNISNSSANEEPAESATTSGEASSESVLPKFKRPKIKKVANEADKAFVDWMKRKETAKDNPRKMFLLSLLSDVESLSEEQMRMFRIKVLLLLEEIQSGAPQQRQSYTDNYAATHRPQQYNSDNYLPVQHSEQYRDYSSTQQLQYRDNYSPSSSVGSNSHNPVSPINYSANTNCTVDLSELQNLENL